ncbi:MAG: tryptophan synthase subunit alpha, partial [Acidobacteria bacterium]|nr:tryptophan synthase subunit alpha [Acidobacteriota bacterium]
MSRLDSTFSALRAARQPGLVAFATAGDPDLPRSEAVFLALDAAGASVLEIGVPFSDPLADGPVIQRASNRALRGGTTLLRAIGLAARVRRQARAPIVLFTYLNPVLRLGVERFAGEAAQAGVDGVLVVDLPLEEAGPVRDAAAGSGLDTILLVAPTSGPERIRRAAALGGGFLYAVSRLGVTGAQERLPDGARALVTRIRAETSLPIALGFGISQPEHVREAARWSDAAVVGSAIVQTVEEHGSDPRLAEAVYDRLTWLLGAASST